MAIVSDIITQAESLASTTFGATYQRIPYVYDVSKNDLRGSKLGYGVRPLAAITADGVTGVYTMDQDFELVLTDTIARPMDDDERRTALNTMYNQADTYFKALVNTKINLASTVLNVFSPSMSEPEFVDKFVFLRMQFKVKYRSSLT